MATNQGHALWVFAVMALASTTVSQTAMDEHALRRHLLEDYNTHILPMENQSEPMVVYFNLTFQSLLDLNEKEQVLSFYGNLQLMWKTNVLQWDPTQFGGTKGISLKASQIWTPGIAVENSVDNQNKIGADNFLVRLLYDGTIYWYPDVTQKTQCSMGTTKYPFDTQICYIIFSSKAYQRRQLQLVAWKPDLAMHLFSTNGEWDLSNHSVWNGSGSGLHGENKIICELVLKRRIAYHVINTVLPVLLLSVLNVLVFVLPPEAGEKMSLAITVLLAYAVFLTVFNKNMPAVSNSVSLLAIYMIFTLALGTGASFLSSVILNYAYMDSERHRHFFPTKLSQLENYCDDTTSSVNYSTVTETEMSRLDTAPSNGEKRDNIHSQRERRRRCTDRTDVCSFWVIFGLTVIVSAVCLGFMLCDTFDKQQTS